MIEKLFIVLDDVVKPFPKKRSEFLALFGDKSTKIEDYSKINKLKFRDKEDALQMFNYYNSLY